MKRQTSVPFILKDLKLSILIRNLNEAADLALTLGAIQRQACDFAYEVVVVDNMSDDDSVKIAEGFGARVLTLERAAFSFGGSLNYGISQCNGEFILILSAHVLLLSDGFLQSIPAYFAGAAVAGLRFLNCADVSQLKNGMMTGVQSLRYESPEDFAITHWQQLTVNHCAAIRRESWEQQPFDETLFASEDKRWALDVLKQGWSLLYHVPLYYAYIKQPGADGRARRMAIETAAREAITGNADPLYSPGAAGYIKAVQSSLKKMYREVKTNRRVARMIVEIRAEHAGFFRK